MSRRSTRRSNRRRLPEEVLTRARAWRRRSEPRLPAPGATPRAANRSSTSSRSSSSNAIETSPFGVTATSSSPIGDPSSPRPRRSGARPRHVRRTRALPPAPPPTHRAPARAASDRSSSRHQLPQSFRSLVDVGPGGLLAASHELGDLGVASVEHVPMHDGDPLASGQGPHRRPERIAGVGRRLIVRPGVPAARRSAAPAGLRLGGGRSPCGSRSPGSTGRASPARAPAGRRAAPPGTSPGTRRRPPAGRPPP